MSLDRLLRAVRAGEPQAEQRLFREIRRELKLYFRSRAHEDDVEDLIQQTCEIIVAELERFEPRGPRAFRSFVFGVAHHRVLTYRRQVARRKRDPGEWLAEPEPPPSELALWKERRESVRAALAVIRSTFRRAIEGRLADRPDRELAREEGVKTGTVRTRVKRGVELVRAELRRRRPKSTPEPTPT